MVITHPPFGQLAAGALATFTPAAHALPPAPTDPACGFTTATDNSPEAPANSQTGVLYGGPITQAGTLTCTIKVNQKLHAVSSVNGASRSATSATAPTVLAPGVVSYISPVGEPVFLCDQFNDGTTTWWLDARTNTWVPAGTAGAECYQAISGGTGDPIFDPIWDTYDTVIEELIALLTELDAIILEAQHQVDNVVCPALELLAGTYPTPAGTIVINSQGDIFIDGEPFWDCPPYDIIWP